MTSYVMCVVLQTYPFPTDNSVNTTKTPPLCRRKPESGRETSSISLHFWQNEQASNACMFKGTLAKPVVIVERTDESQRKFFFFCFQAPGVGIE